jgi:hypothetical protein
MWQIDPAEAFGEVAFVQAAHDVDLALQRFDQRSGKEGHAVFLSLAIADDQMILAEIDVLDPETEAFQ